MDSQSTSKASTSSNSGGCIEKHNPCSEQESDGSLIRNLDKQEQDDSSIKPITKIPMSGMRELLFVLTICSSQLIALLGATQGIPQMGAIAQTFNVTAKHSLELGWCNAAYATTLGSFVIIAGKLGDILGHKPVFVAGYAWLSLWSILAGFSRYSKSNPVFFYFCRGAQGIGTALMTPTSLSLIGKTYPDCKRKNYVFTLFGACAPWGIVCGLVFSSIFTQFTHWSWTYWSMGIVTAVITLISIYIIPTDPNDVISRRNYNYRDFDYIGGFCGISGSILFSVVWNQAPQSTFSSVYVYVLLIISVLLIIAALIIDSRVKDPLIPWTDICHETARVLACVFLSYLAFTVWLFYSWRYAVVTKSEALMAAAAKTVPVAVTAIFAAIVSAFAINHGVPTQIRMFFGLFCTCISCILLATVTGGQTYWGELFVSNIFIAFAMDIIFPSATLLFSDGVPDDLKGISQSLVATVLNYATALGPGIATTIIRYRCFECLNRVAHPFTKTVHIAAYFAIGCSGVGVLIAIYGSIYELYIRKDKKFVPHNKRK